MTTDPLDPRATDADRLLRQERGESPSAIGDAFRAMLVFLRCLLGGVHNDFCPIGWRAALTLAAKDGANAVDLLTLCDLVQRGADALEHAIADEKARYPLHVVTTDPNLVRGPDGKLYSVHPCSHEECKAMGTTCDAEEVPEPLDTSGALADIAARVNALPHGHAIPSVGLGGSGDAFDALRAVDGAVITEHPDEEEPPFRPACMAVRVTIGGVEFYASHRRPR